MLGMLLAACGTSGEDDTDASDPSGPASSTPTASSPDESAASAYIDPGDTARLNQASEGVRKATVKANSRDEYDKCVGLAGEKQMQACFNALFESVVTALEEQSSSLSEFADGDYRGECLRALRQAGKRTDAGTAAISALIVHSDTSRAQRERVGAQRYDVLIQTYRKTQRALVDFQEPCFAAKDR
jgi:hypothetical protein